MIAAPCKDCEERKPGCHAECEKYAEFRTERQKQKEHKNAERARIHQLNSYEFDNYRKRKYSRRVKEE